MKESKFKGDKNITFIKFIQHLIPYHSIYKLSQSVYLKKKHIIFFSQALT